MAEGGCLNMADARRMLSSCDFGSSSKAGESALYALDMVRGLRSSILAGRGPTPDSADWKVAKAVVEVMVRWGVYPLLSPGVGIPVERRFKNRAAVAGAAGAVLEHAQQQAALPRVCDTLYDSAEFLVEVVLDLSPNAGALRDLVISDHLPDLWAACLQLCYGPVLVGGPSEAPVQRRSGVSEMIDWLVEKLPVSHAVEAVLTLLAQDNSPPPWLKSEAGKILSRLVMRDGGVVAVLERLVGNAPQGDVAVQMRVASHLARSPKYVAKAQDYYKRICPQILHLLSLRTSATDRRQIGEAGVRVVRNMHHTSVIMVCLISQQEPQLMEAFLMEPLLEPLLKWASGKSGIVEKRLIDSLLQLHVLITAGHEGASVVKQMLVRKTKGIAPRLVLLHQLLEGGKTRKSASAKERRVESNSGLDKGFLKSRDSDDEDADADNIVNRVRDSVGDILLVHMMEPIDHSLSICCNYIFHCNSKYLEWPGGDIGAAIESHKSLSRSPALYISRLLLAIQNWELTVRVLNRIFYRILELRRNLVAGGDVLGTHEESKELQRLMQVWEQMLEVVGSKAFEQDTVAAVSFVKDLLHNKEVLDDPDLLELVFHMLHRLGTEGGKKHNSEDWKPVVESLTMICSSSYPERIKQMASTLQNSINDKFQP